MNNLTSMEAAREVAHLVLRVTTGDLTYSQGNELAKPYLEIMNTKGREIAKKYKKSFKPFTWGYMLRLGV